MPKRKRAPKKALRAVGYIRVSTDMQAEEGYSLENQEHQIKEYVKYQNMQLVHIYKEEKGASGKNIEGRPQFQQMLADIAKNRDIDYIVVLNMSRFARNAADALVTLNKLKSYNVNLYLIDDKLDTSSKTGSAMFSLSSIFAELERNNIRENTTAGRYQKARNGLWNGAQAPFGYRLDNGKLVIEESEAEVVRIIFDRYVHTPDGIHKIAVWLNEHGYKKEPRGNGKYVFFSPGTLKNILDNPVYAGKIAYGRRRMEQVEGENNEFRPVRQDKEDWQISEGQHEAIVSPELFDEAQKRREAESTPFPRKRSDHVNLLTGLLVCPICGRKMIATNTRGKVKKDGTLGKETHAYNCKYSKKAFGPDCTFTKQYRQELIDKEIDDVIGVCLDDKLIAEMLTYMHNEMQDTEAIEGEIAAQEKQVAKLETAIRSLSATMDAMDGTEPAYERKYRDLQERQDKLYEQIDDAERKLDEAQRRLDGAREGEATVEEVKLFLTEFGKAIGKVDKATRKTFYAELIDTIEIVPDADWKHGEGIVSRIRFKLPMIYGDKRTLEVSRREDGTLKPADKEVGNKYFRVTENTDECIALIQRVKS
ncbi:recombinase family protein [Streptococcus anginosus]|uniref:recombinase family protein n=1 Tax=Streptococcus TaxID=1301 RepID=UPI0008A855A0|nr:MULTISPECIES: recombinase family protein [Streptococcus]KAA9262363.1 recombinase family protein [Streptococcus anginosus]KAA9303587.1 recombinase family protein [Streptococcus anginosus]MBS6902547.1 recombinase family protein [Streptococcus anginosus]MCW1056586.1 recombinase family protein [Streptococcus anginosus]MCW1075157.1 recombinase family protein [Streptococcus anginosus]